MNFEIRAMSVSEILDTAFQLLRTRFRDLASIGFVIYLPFAVLSIVVAQMVGTEAEQIAVIDPEQVADVAPALAAVGLISALAYLFGYPLLIVTVTLLVGGVYLGRRATIAESLRAGLGRFWGVLGTFLLFSLFMMGSFMVVGVLFVLATSLASSVGNGIAFVVGAGSVVGFLFFLVFFSAAYAVVLQVVVFERVAGVPAIRRALQLTDGMRLRTLGVIFAATLLLVLAGVAIELLLSALPVVSALATWAMQAIGFAYYTCAQVVLYFDLRCRKEAFDLEYLAQLVEAG